MTALEYRDALRRLGMTTEYAAKLQGISETLPVGVLLGFRRSHRKLPYFSA